MGMLTLGPVLFNWEPDSWRDFYLQVADEAPVETVFIGEVICSKRAPLFDRHLEQVVTRLEKAGKTVIFSSLAQITTRADRKLVERIAAAEGFLVEANDVSALWHLGNRPHTIGPYMNVYNEETVAHLVQNGATRICLPPELPDEAIGRLTDAAGHRGVPVEVIVYGRLPLALSARCYHARAEGRTKDSCRYVCERDPDGMVLTTLDNEPVLAINGIQTLSHGCLNLSGELCELRELGVSHFRISPHSVGTFTATEVFRAVLDGEMDPAEATGKLKRNGIAAPFSNGFFHAKRGIEWNYPSRTA